jgi:quercetin dioxygenase-like cupin family protein
MKNIENASSPVVRIQLLTAQLNSPKIVEHIEIRRVDMAPNIASGLHLHPCPVVGMILEGSVLFQVDGELARVMHTGDAFYEPANVRIPHFDALEEGASFVAHYLLSPGETETIQMLEELP